MPTKRLFLTFGNSILLSNTAAFSVTLYSIGIVLFSSLFSAHAQLSIGTDIYIDEGAELHIATQETRFHQGMLTAARGNNYGLVSFAPQSTWTLADHNSHVDGFVRMHSNDTFTPNGNLSIEYLVVAGGGGGGQRASDLRGGGGGAGGFVTGSATITDADVSITVGAGGAPNVNGGNSSIGAIASAIGGGAGGEMNSGSAAAIGHNGGSGGGAGTWFDASNWQPANGGAGTAGQGNAGGNGTSTNAGVNSGGGGGAGAAGQVGSGNAGGGAGGAGLSSDITGATVWCAGGGGATHNFLATSAQPGGIGGGGAGLQNGTANTGGGGGGGGGSGGSGVVIIRYLTPTTLVQVPFLETKDDKVGIGTDSPTEKLEVDGNLKVTGSISSGDKISGTFNAGVAATLGTLSARLPASGNRSLQIHSTTALTITGGDELMTTNIGAETFGSLAIAANTWTYVNTAANFSAHGNRHRAIFYDETSGEGYRITLIIGAGYNNNFISIEKLN